MVHKHTRYFIALLVLVISSSISAQLKEGYFQYNIQVTAIDTALKTRQMVGLLVDSKMEFTFTSSQSRMDFKMGEFSSNSIIIDTKQKAGLSLFTTLQGKYAMQMNENQINAKSFGSDSATSVQLIAEEKTILGFNCKKAILKQGTSEMTYWYTKDITVDKSGQTMLNDRIPGFPLFFSMISDGILMEFQASNYKFEVADKATKFSLLVPVGYTVIANTGKK